MKGLLLAGGHGTRLRPLTYSGNKHTLPIANKPMLLYGLGYLRDAGIKEIGIVLGPLKEGIQDLVSDGSKFGVHVSYIEQPVPRGLAHAVRISEDFIGESPFVMYLGDNLLRGGVTRFVETFSREHVDCVVGATPTSDPTRFGVVELKNGEVVRLEEKPKHPKSNLALVGVYVFGPSVFQVVRELKPSWRNEFEITDAIQGLVDARKRVKVEMVDGWWKDAGKPEDLLEANQLVLADLKPSVRTRIPEGARLSGPISVGKNNEIKENVELMGPSIIGDGCVIGPDVSIGPSCSIGDDCTLSGIAIENSIIMKGCTLRGGRIVASVVGSYSEITMPEAIKNHSQRLILGERSIAKF